MKIVTIKRTIMHKPCRHDLYVRHNNFCVFDYCGAKRNNTIYVCSSEFACLFACSALFYLTVLCNILFMYNVLSLVFNKIYFFFAFLIFSLCSSASSWSKLLEFLLLFYFIRTNDMNWKELYININIIFEIHLTLLFTASS